MDIKGKVVLITGAASGIGEAMAKRFLAEGAAGLVLADVQDAALERLAAQLNWSQPAAQTPVPVLARRCDVTREADIQALVAAGEEHFGRIDICCSNAGLIRDGGEEASDESWQLNWNIHVMAHVWMCRAVLPGMIRRGEGYLLITASAAGLLTSLPSSSYAVTKHASIAFAESMSIRHGPEGIRVSVLCPQAVDTPMMDVRRDVPGGSAQIDEMLSPDRLCDTVIEGIASEQFLMLPHPQVLDFFKRKATDYDRWLGGMRKLDQRLRLGMIS